MAPATNSGQGLPREAVQAAAKLARLALSAEALEVHRRHLAAVVDYVETLHELDLSSVEPLAHPLDAIDRLDPDEPRSPMPRDAFLAIAPQTDGPFLKVPKVIGEGA